ncbi:hypothetical protein IFM89_036941 [Coptis chinensis]|uniref:RanBP2-type domain-containing protein n=1 Tax=Coptis chinensis TaxID=261450 RepID=A0A835HZA0_9MAGN|nr:hypothetical protein IFM89_036941 [Coptis chinensis]
MKSVGDSRYNIVKTSISKRPCTIPKDANAWYTSLNSLKTEYIKWKCDWLLCHRDIYLHIPGRQSIVLVGLHGSTPYVPLRVLCQFGCVPFNPTTANLENDRVDFTSYSIKKEIIYVKTWDQSRQSVFSFLQNHTSTISEVNHLAPKRSREFDGDQENPNNKMSTCNNARKRGFNLCHDRIIHQPPPMHKDKRTGQPKIWFYRNKETNELKGDTTVTYEDPHAALAAVEWFNNKDFHGSIIRVFMAESKNAKDEVNVVEDPVIAVDLPAQKDAIDMNEGGGKGRGRGNVPGKAWQQYGDWMCPNTRWLHLVLITLNCFRCGNINWAKRLKCNICNTNNPGHNEGGVR